jgi:hypothetical protein
MCIGFGNAISHFPTISALFWPQLSDHDTLCPYSQVVLTAPPLFLSPFTLLYRMVIRLRPPGLRDLTPSPVLVGVGGLITLPSADAVDFSLDPTKPTAATSPSAAHAPLSSHLPLSFPRPRLALLSSPRFSVARPSMLSIWSSPITRTR